MGLALYIRLGLDGKAAARLIVPQIESAIGKKVSYSTASLVWISPAKAKIAFTEVKLSDRADAPPLLSVPAASFEIDVGTIWRGSLTVSRAMFSKPLVTVGPGFSLAASNSPNSSLIGRVILSHLSIETLEVTEAGVADTIGDGRSGQSAVHLSRFRMLAKNLTIHGVGSVIARGDMSSGNQTGSFEFSGTLEATPLNPSRWKGQCRLRLTGCPLKSLRAISRWCGQELPFSDGLVNLALNFTGRAENFKARGGIELSRVILSNHRVFGKNVPVEYTVAEFGVERIGDSIQIDLPKARLPGMSISGEARLGRVSRKDADLTIALKSSDIDLKKIFPLLPLNLLEQEDRNRLVRAGLKGHVRVTGGAWTGKISELARRPSLRGTVALEGVLDGVSGFVPGIGLPVESANGTVHMNSDKMLFKGISLTIGSSPIVLNGSITNLKAAPTADLFVSMKAQAQDLYPLLTSNAFAGSIKPWLSPVIDPRGGVAVTLDLKGNLSRPSMKGRITFEDFQCGFSGFPLALRDFNGSMRFRQTGIEVSEMKGLIGESPTVLKGSVTSGKVALTCDVKLTSSDSRMLCRLPSDWAVTRGIPIAVSVKGNAPNLDFTIGVDLKRTGLTFGSIIAKKSGTPLTIEASGSASPGGILVEEASLILPGNRIAAGAKIDSEGQTLISVNLPPKGIPTQALIPFIHPSLELQPGGRIEGDAAIRLGKTGIPDLDARLQFAHVSFRIPGFHKRTVGMVASMRQKGNAFHLIVDRAKNGSSVFSGTLTVTDMHDPKVDASLLFTFLDTTDFDAPPGYVSNVTWGEWIQVNPAIRFLARSTGKAFVKVVKGKAPLRTFANFQANVEGKDGLLKVPSWQINIADGIIRGTALFDIRRNTKTPFALDFQADQLRMESVMMSDPEWLRVEGDVVVNGKLQWNLSTSREHGGVYKTGNIEVRVHDGKVNRFDIMSKLFSLINLGSILRGRLPDLIQQGLPFQSLTWDMDVFDTKWKFKDMKLISDAARINASGMYFSDQDRIDFQVDVSPLVGFDQIFSGLFGNLVTKNGKLLTTTFRVRGLTGSPDVRLMPFEQFKSSR